MSIKKVNPEARFKLICEHDSALDKETDKEMEKLKEAEKQSRYEDYMDSLDESILKFKKGEKPDYFQFRCLTNEETAILQDAHVKVDTKDKKSKVKSSSLLFLEAFNFACEGMFNDKGKLEKVSSNEVGFAVATSVGATV